MFNENFVILGAIIAASGSITYAIQTLQGKVKPNRVTFFLWSFAPLIAFVAQVQQGVGLVALPTLMASILPLMIFLASFVNKSAYWKLTTFDIICGLLSILGLILWYITKVGNVAILLGILADGLAGLPTVVKAYKHPQTESSIGYFTTGVSAVITLTTIKEWDFAHVAFPIYLFFITFTIFALVHFKLGKIIARK